MEAKSDMAAKDVVILGSAVLEVVIVPTAVGGAQLTAATALPWGSTVSAQFSVGAALRNDTTRPRDRGVTLRGALKYCGKGVTREAWARQGT